jgi:hypothetical protein
MNKNLSGFRLGENTNAYMQKFKHVYSLRQNAYPNTDTNMYILILLQDISMDANEKRHIIESIRKRQKTQRLPV